MQRLEDFTLYQNPDPLLVSRQATFPGIVQVADGDLVAIFSIGQAFDGPAIAIERSLIRKESVEASI